MPLPLRALVLPLAICGGRPFCATRAVDGLGDVVETPPTQHLDDRTGVTARRALMTASVLDLPRHHFVADVIPAGIHDPPLGRVVLRRGDVPVPGRLVRADALLHVLDNDKLLRISTEFFGP